MAGEALRVDALALVRMAVPLRRVVVTVVSVRGGGVLPGSGVTRELGERRGDALHRQHSQHEQHHESLGTIYHTRAESIEEPGIPQFARHWDSTGVQGFRRCIRFRVFIVSMMSRCQ